MHLLCPRLHNRYRTTSLLANCGLCLNRNSTSIRHPDDRQCITVVCRIFPGIKAIFRSWIGTAKAKQFSAFDGNLFLAILIGFHIAGIIREHCLDINNYKYKEKMRFAIPFALLFAFSVTNCKNQHKIQCKYLGGFLMSDLVATNCGCGNDNNNGCCSSLIWIILILALCGNGSSFSNDGCGCGNSIWIILLLLCCCNDGGGCGSFF